MVDNRGETTRSRMIEFIKSYHNEHGYMPSYREIGEGIGLYSLDSVHHHMEILFEFGVLESEHQGFPRAYRLKEDKK